MNGHSPKCITYYVRSIKSQRPSAGPVPAVVVAVVIAPRPWDDTGYGAVGPDAVADVRPSVHCTLVLPLLNVAAEKEDDERNRSEMYTAAVPDYT